MTAIAVNEDIIPAVDVESDQTPVIASLYVTPFLDEIGEIQLFDTDDAPISDVYRVGPATSGLVFFNIMGTQGKGVKAAISHPGLARVEVRSFMIRE
jgi:hypothetical protein